MKTYCVSYKKILLRKVLNVRKTKQNRLMILTNRTTCGKEKTNN